MNLDTVRTNLAAAAANAGDFDAFGFIPDSITTPCFAVGRMQIDYDQAFGGLVALTITCHYFASRADSQQGQTDVMTALASGALKTSIQADRTLAGACQELNVPTAEGPGLVDVGGIQYWAASLTVKVWG